MSFNFPFQNGHNKALEKDVIVKLSGFTDKSLKNKIVRIKGLTETDILEIRGMLLDEVKRQKEERL